MARLSTSSVPPALRSVRVRITLAAALAVGAVVAIAGLALTTVQRGQLLDRLDRDLVVRSDVLADLDLETAVRDVGSEPVVLGDDTGDDVMVQFVDGDGRVVAASPNALGLAPVAPGPSGSVSLTSVDELPIEDDEFRIVARRLTGADAAGDSGASVVLIAENTDDVNGVVDGLRALAVGAVPVSTLAIGALVWVLVGRTLRPVEDIRRRVAGIGGSELDRRVPVSGAGDEIDRLAVTMNSMLARLDDSARRQRRFSADASHELRTPLTRMRSELQTVDLDDPTDVARLRDSALDEIDEMASLVDDLLVLARADSTPARHRPLDLDDVVLEEVSSTVSSGGVTIDVSGVSGAHLEGDAGELRRVVRNLLDNAVRHATTSVWVSSYEADEAAGSERRFAGSGAHRVVLVVADDGPGVEATEVERIFEPFVRLDESRTRGGASDGGAGLGLAIVREIVGRHGGSVRVEPNAGPGRDDGPGARFVIELPGRPPQV